MNDRTVDLVVGYDLREASQDALLVAVDLAERLGARLHIVHVVDLLDYPVDPDSSDWEDRGRMALDEEHERVEALMAGARVDWTYYPERGEPVRAITAIADRHDALMIVVGTRGAGFGASMQRLLGGGSVSHGLLREHSRPVLIVSQPPGGPGGPGAREAGWDEGP
ncbi:MAG: universal stress protein [Acidimicrobiales bacterium]|jgi:nucleotide-binding universal stress UspA family protein